MNRTFLVPLVLGASGCGLLGGEQFVGNWIGTEFIEPDGEVYYLPSVYTYTVDDTTITQTSNLVLRVEEGQVTHGYYDTYVGSDGSYEKEQYYLRGTWERVEKGRYALFFPEDLSVECTLDDDEVACTTVDGSIHVFAPDEE